MKKLSSETAGRLPEVYYYSEQFLADGVKRKLQSLRFIIDAIETPDRISVGPKARRFTRSSKNSIKRKSYLARAKSGAGQRSKTSSIDSRISTSSSKGVSMNLDSLFTWVVGIVVAVAFTSSRLTIENSYRCILVDFGKLGFLGSRRQLFLFRLAPQVRPWG